MKINSAGLAGSLLIITAICLVIAPKHTESFGTTPLNLLPETQALFVPQQTEVKTARETDVFLPQSSEEAVQKPLRVLIYHTHLTEAYRQDGTDSYTETSAYRTLDLAHNVASLGEELKRELEAYGYEVIHDTTDHEPPKLSTAYTRSLATMEHYDGIDLYIDLHRDASGAANVDDVVTVDGERCARMMFVVGKGYKSDGTPYDPLPDFEKNFALAEQIAANVNGYAEGFMRETRVKRGRYNQHVSDHCLLVEVGHNMNTLAEAKHSIVYLAAAIHETLAD